MQRALGDSGSSQTANASSEKMNSSLFSRRLFGLKGPANNLFVHLEMDQKMVISNSSDSNGTNRSQEILTKSFEAGSLNLTDKAMKMVMATLAVEAGHEENTSAMCNSK
jgi:hypothetical protein